MLAVCAVLEYIHTNTHIHKHPRVSTRRRAHMCHTPDTPIYMTNTCEKSTNVPLRGSATASALTLFLAPTFYLAPSPHFLPSSLPDSTPSSLAFSEEGRGCGVTCMLCVCARLHTHTNSHTRPRVSPRVIERSCVTHQTHPHAYPTHPMHTYISLLACQLHHHIVTACPHPT